MPQKPQLRFQGGALRLVPLALITVFPASSSAHLTHLLLTSSTPCHVLSQKPEETRAGAGHEVESREWGDKETESSANSGRGQTGKADRLIVTSHCSHPVKWQGKGGLSGKGQRGHGVPGEIEEIEEAPSVVMAAWQGRHSIGTSWGLHFSESHCCRTQDPQLALAGNST